MLVECDCGASCDAVENDPGCLKETRWREKLKGVATVRMQGDVKLTRLVRFVNLFIQRVGLEALFDFVSFPLLKLGLKSAVTHTHKIASFFPVRSHKRNLLRILQAAGHARLHLLLGCGHHTAKCEHPSFVQV